MDRGWNTLYPNMFFKYQSFFTLKKNNITLFTMRQYKTDHKQLYWYTQIPSIEGPENRAFKDTKNFICAGTTIYMSR